tara:strand:+ start:518 stop:1495 length:978 start_codon:yes stop_codon:yes gene_type:complete
MDLFKYEKLYWSKGIDFVGGIDEAGRGPLAGPVVAACVILSKDFDLTGIDDSKKISPKKRKKLYDRIINESVDVSIGIAHEKEIDDLNILQATFLAMRRAIRNLNNKPRQLLIDGPHSDIKIIPTKNIVKGDSKSGSIAAASIIAKVYRDEIMRSYDIIFPEYDFSKNKGYGTKSHIKALHLHKATPIHRKTFKIVNSNLPTFSFYKSNNLLAKMGSNYVISNYVKEDYLILEMNINLEDIDDKIDCLITDKHSNVFIKIISTFNNSDFSIGNLTISSFDRYILSLEKYLIKKDFKKDFVFNVISVEFNKGLKPKINIIRSEKSH